MSTRPETDLEHCAEHAGGLSRLEGKYMTFKLDQEEYGLEILKVEEVIALMDITRVPKAPPFIKGVFNLRGKVIPVVDLRLKFDMEKTVPTDQTVIIVVQYCSSDGSLSTMGILVDEVLEVLSIRGTDIEPAPSLGDGGAGTGFLLGIGKSAKKVIFLLDIDKVLSSRD